MSDAAQKRLDTLHSVVIRSREAGRDRAKLGSRIRAPKVAVPSGTSVLPESVARWRTSRRLARNLHERLVQFDVDASRELCYTIIMLLDREAGSRRDS